MVFEALFPTHCIFLSMVLCITIDFVMIRNWVQQINYFIVQNNKKLKKIPKHLLHDYLKEITKKK